MNLFFRCCFCIAWPFFNLIYPTFHYGRENIPEGAAIICANHIAYSDAVMLALGLGIRVNPRFMAKEELMNVPILGRVVKWLGAFGVKRGQSDGKAFKTAYEVLCSGDKLMMFPEGTRAKKGKTVRAHSGAIRLAVESGAPLLPVYIPEKKRIFRRNTVVIGKPYVIDSLEGYEQASKLAEQLVEKIYLLAQTNDKTRLGMLREGK